MSISISAMLFIQKEPQDILNILKSDPKMQGCIFKKNLIYQPKHVIDTQKNHLNERQFFGAAKTNDKQMNEKIIIISIFS